MTQSDEPTRGLMSRYLGPAILFLLGVMLGVFICRNGIANFFRNLADNSDIWVLFASVGAYLWIARRFLDPLAKRRNWRPFMRDYFNLAAFFVIVPSVFAAIYFGVVRPVFHIAEVLAQ